MLAVTVTLLVCFEPSSVPLPLESNSTLISPEAPGAIGSLGQSGTVHPQLPLASEITNGSLPVFLNLYMIFSC